MIVVGYQGIGKTTISKSDLQYIDLESSHFSIDGQKLPNWEIPYARTALYLSYQGYCVFTSAHPQVRQRLLEMQHMFAENGNACRLVTIAPTVGLKEPWIAKLQERYNASESDKDARALAYAKDHYEKAVTGLLAQPGFDHIAISSMDYNLKQLIQEHMAIGEYKPPV